MTYPVPTHVAFAALAAVAAASDCAIRRIPNWLSVPLLAGGVAAQALLGPSYVLSGIGAALLVGLGLLPLWAARRLGGGDLKLAVAAAAWIGLAALPRYLLASALAAGALAVMSYASSHREARLAIRANLRAVARGHAIAPPLGAVAGRAPVAAGAAFAVGAAWVLAGG
jgi:Flp pilus assembly protein protease CpaA